MANDPFSGKGDVITIDGPAGAGKSTIARLLAVKIGYEYLDTGAIYRGVTLFLSDRSITPMDGAGIAKALDKCSVVLAGRNININGEDVTEKIRSTEIDKKVSAYSAVREVRRFLLKIQRKQSLGRRMVAEGRDMGSVVFPDARVKIYLDASLEVRSERRWKELGARGASITLDEVRRQVEERDRLDSEREISPLRIPEKAHVIDSSGKSPEAVVEEIMGIISGRAGG